MGADNTFGETNFNPSPSAEGAAHDNTVEQNKRMREWFKERTGLEDTLLSVHMKQIDVMLKGVQNKPQPTAEGAEEILKRHCKENKIILTSNDFHTWLNAINEIATLHAQRLAEKMVEEKLREELIAYDKWVGEKYIDNYRHETAPAIVDEYLKSKEQ